VQSGRCGKTGGPFESSIAGTCQLVDVTTASEFVIALPLSPYSPSFSLPLRLRRSLAVNRQNLRISTQLECCRSKRGIPASWRPALETLQSSTFLNDARVTHSRRATSR